MHYIVFDLEWNQCPDGKKRENPRLPFEIIEIGAVKLNSSLQIIDQFHEIITPKVYRRLHYMTKSVISLREKDLRGHLSFPQVMEKFFSWCGGVYGEDYLFATYGPADLPELQRNLTFYHLSSPLKFPVLYLDVQKLFSLATEGSKRSHSLEYAVNYYHLPKEDSFHNAYHDARYTANILIKLPQDLIQTYYSVDYYLIPKRREDELHLSFPTYTKYVSRAFPDKESALKDRDVSGSTCIICGKRCRKKIRWFPSSGRSYQSLAYCPDHGLFQGKLHVKTRPGGSVFMVRTQKAATPADGYEMRLKQQHFAKRKKAKNT